MIGEFNVRLWRYQRHMASHATRTRMGRSVARGALLVVPCRVALQFPMRIVARQARQGSLAFEKTGAPAQIDRLVPDVPGLGRITQRPVLRRPVAIPAELVERGGGQPSGILNEPPGPFRLTKRSGFHMQAGRPMTSLAAHAGLRRPDLPIGPDAWRAGRMALEALHDSRDRIDGLV